MKQQFRGWWRAALAAALVAPTLAPRPVAAGPFDYIKKTDTVRNSAPQNSPPQPSAPRQPAQPSRPQPSPVAQPRPFSYISPQPVTGPRTFTSPSAVVTTPSAPSYRPSFGTIRPTAPLVYTPPPSRPQIPQSPRTFPTMGTIPYPPTSGSTRGGTNNAPLVMPVPRSGHGTLGGYFGRDPHPRRDRGPRYYPGPYVTGPYYGNGYYRDRYGRYSPYPPGYDYYPCPYDFYPPTLYYPQPYPSVVIVPQPETVVVPEPAPIVTEPGGDREQVEGATLREVMADIEEAWESGKLDLLMRHVPADSEVQVYRDGESIDSLSRRDFAQKTEQAFRDYDTVSMTFEKPEMLGDDETGAPRARARATHIYKTRSGEERRVHVTYAFRRSGRTWQVVGLDYERTPRPQASSDENPPSGSSVTLERALAPAHRTESRAPALAATSGQLLLVSAPPVRLHDVLTASQPRTVAKLKWLQGGQRSFYTVQAMRGVAPGTVAWALYRQGEKQPAETGTADVRMLASQAWIAVRPQGPQLVTLAANTSARPRLALLATRLFPGARLTLAPATAPAQRGHGEKPRHRTRSRKLRAHRVRGT